MTHENSAEYEAAREKVNAAARVFESVRQSYRKRLVDDDCFLAARKVYDAAIVEFDAAYNKEAGRSPICEKCSIDR